MEKCDGDLLMSLTESPNQKYDEKEASYVMKQVMTGLDFCHRRGIFHGDIKPENLLLKDDVVKLTDFSIKIYGHDDISSLPPCSSVLNGDGNNNSSNSNSEGSIENIVQDKNSGENIGSTVYAAPELRQGINAYISNLSAADVWSAGVTLFVMCSGYIPWRSTSMNDENFARFIATPASFFPSSFS